MKKLILLSMFAFAANAATVDCQVVETGRNGEPSMMIAHVVTKTQDGVLITAYTDDPFNPQDPQDFYFERDGELKNDFRNNRVEIQLNEQTFKTFSECMKK